MGRCCGVDHHAAGYTEDQKADLELVQAFNRRIAAAIEQCRDVAPVEALLDPDPLRYMWVDEGDGRLATFLQRGQRALNEAGVLEGHRRDPGHDVTTSGMAVRPAVAVAADGTRLFVWLEWVAGEGERLLARVESPDTSGTTPTEPIVVSPGPGRPPADHFRPTTCFDSRGGAWVLWSRSDGGRVAVWCRRLMDGQWTAEEQVSTRGHPSFNQEAAVHPDGTVEVCWQGPSGAGFGIWSRRWRDGRWAGPPGQRVSTGTCGPGGRGAARRRGVRVGGVSRRLVPGLPAHQWFGRRVGAGAPADVWYRLRAAPEPGCDGGRRAVVRLRPRVRARARRLRAHQPPPRPAPRRAGVAGGDATGRSSDPAGAAPADRGGHPGGADRP